MMVEQDSFSGPEQSKQRLADIRRCFSVCLMNNWRTPPVESIWRMVVLKEAWLRGERSEDPPEDQTLGSLRFFKWLYQQGRIGN